MDHQNRNQTLRSIMLQISLGLAGLGLIFQTQSTTAFGKESLEVSCEWQDHRGQSHITRAPRHEIQMAVLEDCFNRYLNSYPEDVEINENHAHVEMARCQSFCQNPTALR